MLDAVAEPGDGSAFRRRGGCAGTRPHRSALLQARYFFAGKLPARACRSHPQNSHGHRAGALRCSMSDRIGGRLAPGVAGSRVHHHPRRRAFGLGTGNQRGTRRGDRKLQGAPETVNKAFVKETDGLEDAPDDEVEAESSAYPKGTKNYITP